jgi:hypothetical protein
LGGNYVDIFDFGYDYHSFLGGDAWLVKTDAFGDIEWNQTYSGEYGADWANSLVETPDGGYALAGCIAVDYPSKYWFDGDFWLVKTDSFGSVEWNQTYRVGSSLDIASSLVVTSDGGYAMAGTNVVDWIGMTGWFTVEADCWLIKTDSYGNLEWNQTYGGTGRDRVYSLIATSDGGYAIGGVTTSFGSGGYDFWLIKTDEYGVVPEAAWVILPLLVTATLVIIISKKKRKH